MGLYYLGAFPPGYGGVTVKNMNLFYALSTKIEIQKIDFNKIKRHDLKELWRLISSLFSSRNRFIIGVSGRKTRKRFSRLLYILNRKAMNKSILIVMGGTASNDIANDSDYRKYVAEYKKIYVETEGMKTTLIDAGLNNAALYPNCRFRPSHPYQPKVKNEGKLKCVFFSLIQPEKGTDIILEAAKSLPEIEIVFYGHIDKSYETSFLRRVQELNNVSYNGIFKGTSEDVYTEIRKYDLLLLPTRWKAEGVPGILVEAKIACVPCVVSNMNYNSEIVKDGVEGIVLSENNPEQLVKILNILNNDREKLQEMSKGSLISANKYYIESYLDEICGDVTI